MSAPPLPTLANATAPWGLPLGVRDMLPAAAAARREISAALLALFAKAGFAYVATPMFEYANVLARGLGNDAETALRFVEPGTGEFLAVRPDFTPQLARLVAQRYRDYRGDLRLCYEGSVYRIAPGHGPREIAQAGVEWFGSNAGDADARVLRLACEVLGRAHRASTRRGATEATLEIGHVAPAQWLLAQGDAATRSALLAALRARNHRAVARASAPLGPQARRLAAALVSPTFEVVPTRNGVRRQLDAALALPWPRHVRAALAPWAAMVNALETKAKGMTLLIDFAEVRGFDYYTGLRFAGYARGLGDAVLRGGRYDTLVARYGRSVPAVGFGVDIEAMDQRRG